MGTRPRASGRLLEAGRGLILEMDEGGVYVLDVEHGARRLLGSRVTGRGPKRRLLPSLETHGIAAMAYNQDGVACGQHWIDDITYRHDDRVGFVFDNEHAESGTLAPSNHPNAEALARDGPPRILRDRAGHVAPFASWRPAH